MANILNLGSYSTHWKPISTEKLCIPHSTLNSSLMRWKKSSRTFSKKCSVAVGAMLGSSQTPSQNKNVKLFHSEAVEENLVKPSSEKPAAEQIMKSNSDPLHNQLCNGGFVESNRLLYRQKFVIRSYEVGADKATSITTILSFFQVCTCSI